MEILMLNVDERARQGLFVAWQNPVTLPGVSVFALAKAALEAGGKKIEKLTELKAQLEVLAIRVGLTIEHVERSVNEGFSGGERKRLELLWLLLLEPKVAILDELDSGMDQGGRKLLIEIVQERKKRGMATLIVTHYEEMREKLEADKEWEMKNGQLQVRR